MTNQQIQEVVLLYDQKLAQMGIKIEHAGYRLAHVRWMCKQIMGFLQESPEESQILDKINRWLGFIQGVLYAEGIYSIKEMREHNKPKKTKVYLAIIPQDYWSADVEMFQTREAAVNYINNEKEGGVEVSYAYVREYICD